MEWAIIGWLAGLSIIMIALWLWIAEVRRQTKEVTDDTRNRIDEVHKWFAGRGGSVVHLVDSLYSQDEYQTAQHLRIDGIDERIRRLEDAMPKKREKKHETVRKSNTR